MLLATSNLIPFFHVKPTFRQFWKNSWTFGIFVCLSKLNASAWVTHTVIEIGTEKVHESPPIRLTLKIFTWLHSKSREINQIRKRSLTTKQKYAVDIFYIAKTINNNGLKFHFSLYWGQYQTMCILRLKVLKYRTKTWKPKKETRNHSTLTNCLSQTTSIMLITLSMVISFYFSSDRLCMWSGKSDLQSG